MASAFLVLRMDNGDIIEALEVAAEGVSDWSAFWAGIDTPWVARSARMYLQHGFGEWIDYGGEPKFEGYKSAMFGRELTADDLLRWDDEGGGDVGTWSVQEQLAPSLLDPTDLHFYHEWGPLWCEIGSTVPHAADIERDTVGPFGEPSPARQLTHFDQEFLDDLLDLHSDFVAQVTSGTGSAGLSKRDVELRMLGLA